jgi:hypothetical protein
MVDVARQLLDELMGRNRNNEDGKLRQCNWEDSDVRFIDFFLPNHFVINNEKLQV